MVLTFLEPEMEIPEQTMGAIGVQARELKHTGTSLDGVNDV